MRGMCFIMPYAGDAPAPALEDEELCEDELLELDSLELESDDELDSELDDWLLELDSLELDSDELLDCELDDWLLEVDSLELDCDELLDDDELIELLASVGCSLYRLNGACHVVTYR